MSFAGSRKPVTDTDTAQKERQRPKKNQPSEQPRSGSIGEAVGQEVLSEVVSDYLDLLATSSAVYEIDGQYAIDSHSSGWCQFMNAASRRLTDSKDDEEAKKAGNWHCHESCWQASKQAIATGQPVDGSCKGGINLYALPVYSGDKVVGAINFGYGDPPRDPEKLSALAELYGVETSTLDRLSADHLAVPPQLVDMAKRRLHLSAKLLGEMVRRREDENERKEREETLRLALQSADLATWEYDIATRTPRFSHEMAVLFGHAPGYQPKSIEDVIAQVHPQDAAVFLEGLESIVRDGTSGDFEYRIVLPNGVTVRWLHARETLVRDSVGTPVRIIRVSRDITERKEWEAALQESAARLKAIVDTAVDGIITIDQFGTMETLNPAAEQIFGYPAEYLVGKNVKMLMPDPYHSEHDGYLSRYMKTAERRIIGIGREVVGKRADGTTFPMELGVSETTVGSKRFFTGLVRDISLRRNAEDALRESDERFRHLVAGVTDYGIFLIDTEGRVTSWNIGAERINGFTAEEIVGQPMSRFYTPQDVREGKPQRQLRLAADNNRFEEEAWRVRKDGTQFWANVVLTPLRGQDGKLRGYANITRDITSRRIAEEALKETVGLLRAVVETAVDGIITIDDRGTISSVNPATERIFGYQASELIGQNVKVLMPDPYHSEHDGYLANYRGTGQAKIIGIGREVMGRRKDGSVFPLDLAVSETKLGDKRIFTGIVRDITERKLAEDQIRLLNQDLERRVEERTEELVAANVEMEGFTYSVSHDLRAPLRGIISSSMILLQDHADSLSEDAKEQIMRQVKAAKKLGQLTDDLLKLSRMGREHILKEEVNLTALAEDVAQEIVVASAPVVPRIHIHPGMRAFADHRQLRLLLYNLMGNAVKFTKPGVEPMIEFGSTGPNTFYVRDNGIGFDMQYVDRIFLAFERLHRDEDIPGTGIGLANVKRVVERHGGKIWAESKPGQGTCFYFTVA